MIQLVYPGLIGILALGAQETGPSPQKRFERARIIQELEHDPKRAAELFRAAARQAESEELRTSATLRLGLCLEQLGQTEAAAAAFVRAANGKGKDAERARARLEGQDERQGKLVSRVQFLIGQLRDAKMAGQARKDLVWFGDEAVPFLVQEIEAEQFDLSFVAAAVQTLLELGGREVEAFLDRVARSEDLMLRRAVVRGFRVSKKQSGSLQDKLRQFLSDSDARVREEALSRTSRIVPVARLLDFAEDSSTSVRASAAYAVSTNWRDRALNPDPDRNLKRFIEVLSRGLSDPKHEVRQRFSDVYVRPSFVRALLGSPGGRSLYLSSLSRENLRVEYYGGFPSFAFPPPVDVAEVVETAKKIRSLNSSRKRKRLGTYVLNCLEAWGSKDVPAVLELVGLGYGKHKQVKDWVLEHAQARDLKGLIQHIAEFPDYLDVAKWLRSRKQLGRHLADLRGVIERRLGSSRKKDNLVVALVQSVAAIRSKEAGDCIVELVRRRPYLLPTAVNAVQKWKPPLVADVLMELLVLQGDENTSFYRQGAFHRLAKLAPPGAEDRYAMAYELGLGPAREGRGLLSLFSLRYGQPGSPGGGLTPTRVSGYTDEEAARILDRCLASGHRDAWSDAERWLSGQGQYVIRKPSLEILCRRALDCPDPAQRYRIVRKLLGATSSARIPAASELALRAMKTKDPKMRRLAVRSMNVFLTEQLVAEIRPYMDDADPEIATRVMELLARSPHPDRGKWFETRLGHDSSNIRRKAVSLLIGLDPGRNLAKVLPLMRDRSSSVRLEVIRSCRQLLARKAVPHLLEAMRDPSQGVRDSAKAALEAIRFYDTQKRHWDRWLDGAGFKSPGEALLKQAAADQPRRIRLAAIASLGTLGDPNALPVLIELMRNEDVEIRKTAEAAIQKINSREPDDKK